MSNLPLATANKILEASLAKAQNMDLNPLAISVVDAAGQIICLQRQDGASDLLVKLSQAKAHGCTQLGISSRQIGEIKTNIPEIINSAMTLAKGNLVAAPGGVVIRDAEGTLLGAIGISGDTSDNDETCAIAGIEAAGLVAG
ncbi:GlcG/HbpS family heme-binding protein [Emcibacter sp.]|uniref:GlcG/HbpS family heme-binding protein n=1 Tax=Emcibacter sp. TaxID=1979954 RepID=UPI002AA62E3C|nr:heme-binding protein [Emcibacter sp.]